MQPHPILMHTLHDYRAREVEVVLTRQDVVRAYKQVAASAPRQHLVARALTFLAVIWRFPAIKATGTAAALRD